MSEGNMIPFRPIFYLNNDEVEQSNFKKYFATDACIFKYDTIFEQLFELMAARRPAQTLDHIAKAQAVAEHIGDMDIHDYGNWAYLPWQQSLVHILPEAEFIEVRTDRNRNNITASEQSILAKAKIGIVGLSVGQASAVTLALEGVGRHFRLADFDRLGLSNLNRLRAGIHQLGMNKCQIAAAQMFEIDPYLDISIETDGIHPDRISEFLGDGDRRLDVLVEECDDVAIKILLRQEARKRGIPVVMETSDRGLIDIERFDLEPDRPILHGRVEGVDPLCIGTLSMSEKIDLLHRIIGADTLSARAAASALEVKKTLSTWPQLGSAVALGGALIADTVRRILLGQLTCSGRFYVDLEQLIG